MREDLVEYELFGNEAGEDEKIEILNSYFVEKNEFERFYSPDVPFCVVQSRKGVGKSALLKRSLYKTLQSSPEPIAIYTKGHDLRALQNIDGTTPAELVYGWQQRLCSRVLLEIGKTARLEVDDDSYSLIESSELAGFRGRNIVSALADRLRLRIGGSGVDVQRAGLNNPVQSLKRLAEKSETRVYLFVDDIDATFVNSPDQRHATSTFFSACRDLVSLVRGLTIRASVRTDVWAILKHHDEALDKCEQYVLDLKWTKRESGKILNSKILSYFQRRYPGETKYIALDVRKHPTQISQLVFEPKFPWGTGHIQPYQATHILSNGRPRWAAQLCRMAGQVTYKKRRARISIREVNDVLTPYGQARLDDLYREHSHQCPKMRHLIEAFAGGPRRYTTAELLQRITDKTIRLHGLLDVDGLEKGADSMYLAHFLYRIGFIEARGDSDPNNLEFVSHHQRPDLLRSTVNPDDGFVWEVHPSYRSILRIN